ncbi:hypothetical protein CD148_13070 [Staphylococcus delphini]|nr:hypothetical protein CD148_13070 [Staphylococcus delphini]
MMAIKSRISGERASLTKILHQSHQKFLCLPPFLRFVKGVLIKNDITKLDRPIFIFLNKVL